MLLFRTLNRLSVPASFKVMNDVVPQPTKYFTILREPVSLLASSFAYFGAVGTIHRSSLRAECFVSTLTLRLVAATINQRLRITRSSLPPLPSDTEAALKQFVGNIDGYWKVIVGYKSSLLKNSQAFDLGLDKVASAADVQAELPRLQQKLHLVLIQEYWDESMVLLMREMCWSVKGERTRSPSVLTVGEETKRSLAACDTSTMRQMCCTRRSRCQTDIRLDIHSLLPSAR